MVETCDDEVLISEVGIVFDENIKSQTVLKKQCWSRNINTGSFHRNIADISGNKEAMYYIGHLYFIFGLHCEEEKLRSLVYVHTGAPRVWYFIPEYFRIRFEDLTARYLLNTCYLKELRAGAHLAIIIKSTIFSPRVV